MKSLESWLRRGPAPLVGIDISSSTLKLVELDRARDGRLMVLRCALEPLSQGWIVEGNIEKFDEVTQALQRLVRKAGTKTRDVALALPSSAVITRKLNLPDGLSEDELEVQVEAEAAQIIPSPLSDVALDFCVIGPAPSLAGYVEVLVAAARRERVSDRQGLAEAAGLNPVVMDIESHASRRVAQRAIERLGLSAGKSPVALFEIGAQTTAMQVMLGDDTIYERDQATGGWTLTQAIAQHYGLSPEEAEQKKKLGGLPDDYMTAVLQPFMESLAQELGRALQFFFTSTPYNRVDAILLAGGSASLPGLADVVSRQTGFVAHLLQPFEGMEMARGLNAARLHSESPAYLIATGLAMRRFMP